MVFGDKSASYEPYLDEPCLDFALPVRDHGKTLHDFLIIITGVNETSFDSLVIWCVRVGAQRQNKVNTLCLEFS
jgi:hypothetical protein